MNGHRRHDVFQRSQNEFRHRMQLKRVLTTRWNSTESAVETAMARSFEILTTLSELAESSLSDSETVTAAFGLRKRLKDIRVIISMEILKLAYTSSLVQRPGFCKAQLLIWLQLQYSSRRLCSSV